MKEYIIEVYYMTAGQYKGSEQHTNITQPMDERVYADSEEEAEAMAAELIEEQCRLNGFDTETDENGIVVVRTWDGYLCGAEKVSAVLAEA